MNCPQPQTLYDMVEFVAGCAALAVIAWAFFQVLGMIMTDYRELLIGCGRARDKRIHVPGHTWRDWRGLTTLDISPSCDADLLCDLNAHPPWIAYPQGDRGLVELGYQQHESGDVARVAHPLLGDFWDEIHAYEVLEHLGQQGDAYVFFVQFSEIYRLLRPNGYLCATVPSRYSPWLWGDPSHRRVICQQSLAFLDQEQYRFQIDDRLATSLSPSTCPTPMSDYRDTLKYRADFKLVDCYDDKSTFRFILQAVKPSRYKVYANEQQSMDKDAV